jgi:hypothetical protein
MLLVATEDRLSEAVALKLVKSIVGGAIGIKSIRKNGNGYLRKNLTKFIAASETFPVLLLTDLDRESCAPLLRARWLSGIAPPERLKFRVAVREVEAWLLADRVSVANLLNVASASIVADPEQLADPKRYLIDLARRAPRKIRDELLPTKGTASVQGFGYNECLCKFVADQWSPVLASEASRSLRRAIERIHELAELV